MYCFLGPPSPSTTSGVLPHGAGGQRQPSPLHVASWGLGAEHQGKSWVALRSLLRLLPYPSSHGDMSTPGRSPSRRSRPSQRRRDFCSSQLGKAQLIVGDASSFDLLHATHLLSEPFFPKGHKDQFHSTPRSKMIQGSQSAEVIFLSLIVLKSHSRPSETTGAVGS